LIGKNEYSAGKELMLIVKGTRKENKNIMAKESGGVDYGRHGSTETG